ncbi:MAG: epoxide hydrolase N-terminal domain-containing protein, partial [Pseudomonadales bacterium]|nr:epoxide hydrolase N-terminal domain-containing protein [Pseudomonadales bacterium]
MTPWAIDIDQQVLDDLKARLRLTRWPDRETPDDWSQGIPLEYMQEVHDYWLNHYDWKSREQMINRWPGYRTNIDGLDFHFLHIPSKHADALPLVLTHGWPGSIVEFL